MASTHKGSASAFSSGGLLIVNRLDHHSHVVMGFLAAEVAPECPASRIEYQSHWRGVPDYEDAVAGSVVAV